MNVKELREMISEIPDETEVVFSVNGMDFESPCEGETGIIEFEGICNENGEELQNDGHPEKFKVFALLPHGITEKLKTEGEIDFVEPSLN